MGCKESNQTNKQNWRLGPVYENLVLIEYEQNHLLNEATVVCVGEMRIYVR